MNIWGINAKRHWQTHRPNSYASLTNPEEFFTNLGNQAADRYLVIRDGLLDDVNPNDGTTSWAEYQDLVAKADQTAQEIVDREFIYLPPADSDPTEP